MALFAKPVAVADSKTKEEPRSAGKAVAPEAGFVWGAVIAIIGGSVLGTLIHDHLAKSVSFMAPAGVGIFALFYIMAQVIERVQQPLTPYLGTAEDDSGGRKNQLEAKAALEKAVAGAFAGAVTAQDVASKKRTVDQIRANLTVLVFGTSALLAMVMAGYLKARLLQAVGVSGIITWVDILVTGLVVGAGTKPLHDLISNLSSGKEEKQNPPGT